MWKGRRLISERREIDKEREGGGSPSRENRKPKSTFLDEIDDPHGDYARAGASGHDRGPQYPYTLEDVKKHDSEVKGLLSDYTNPDHASSSSVPRQESVSSAPPAETNEKVHQRGNVIEARKREAERLVPKFEVGEKVKFASEDGKEWLHGAICKWILPGDPRNTLDHPHVIAMYLIEHHDDQGRICQSQIEEDLIDHTLYGQANPRFRLHSKSNKTALVVKISLANSLHDLDLVRIDTCSAVSVSTERDDFLFLDASQGAKDSVTLRGVGGSSSVIGGGGDQW